MWERLAAIRKRIGRRQLLLGGIVCMVLLLATGGAWLFMTRTTGPIPRQYRRGLDFQLYYPTRLPAGYAVDPTSFKRDGAVLIFSIAAPKGRNIAVAEQAIPNNVATHPVKTNAPVPLASEKSFQSSIGNVHISLWGDKYVSDTITDETWLILNVTGFTADEAATITNSFKKL